MTPQCVQVKRGWAQTFGAAVRQRSVRQETTMARAGTLPSYLYQREVRLGESASLECSGEQRRNETEEADDEDGILEYDSSRSHFLLITTRHTMMLLEFLRWIARQLFCLERFHVSGELFASAAEI